MIRISKSKRQAAKNSRKQMAQLLASDFKELARFKLFLSDPERLTNRQAAYDRIYKGDDHESNS